MNHLLELHCNFLTATEMHSHQLESRGPGPITPGFFLKNRYPKMAHEIHAERLL